MRNFSAQSVFRKIRRLVPFRIRTAYFRIQRRFKDLSGRERFSTQDFSLIGNFSAEVFTHKAKLFREYPEPWYSLQKNKVKNLSIAVKGTDSTVIKPGETFSFWKAVGPVKGQRGFLDGMTLVDGVLSQTPGGGLCQLSNALYWTALHIGCTITERHRHSFDVFPDSYRSVPFGAGATVFFNYVDLRFKNDSDNTFLIRTWLDDEYLHVKTFTDRKPSTRYEIREENHTFDTVHEERWRSNDLFRVIIVDGREVSREHIAHNRGRVLY